MKMQTAQRLDGIGEYYFSKKLGEIARLNREGETVINLGIGSPDMPPHPSVIQVLTQAAAKPDVHAYQSYRGAEPLRKAFVDWYAQWYGVHLDPATQVLPLAGSKEGILHICMTYLQGGDDVLIPDPGYPTYRSAVQLAGAKCLSYPMREENEWTIDLEALETNDLSKVKMMWVNYPHMPTGQLPSTELFRRLIAFGRKHNILICHDNPYSFILNDHPQSLLAVEGALDVAIELNSLSKSHNMAGWRVGVLCAAEERVNDVLRFKSNMDSGMFLPLQLAAAQALSLDASWYGEVNRIYRARREKAYTLLDALECRYSKAQAGMFLWAKVPVRYSDAYALSDELLQEAKVFITPGGIFGTGGENYVRVSLCSPEEKFEEAIKRIHHTTTGRL